MMNLNTKPYQVKYSDISGEYWSPDIREFPPIRPSENHVVLFNVSKGSSDNPPSSYKREGDKWDEYHVRMPHSNRNQYGKEASSRYKTESRWVLIKKTLEKMLTQTADSKTLIESILKYNHKFKDVWKFAALDNYLNKHLKYKKREDFFKNTLPGIIKLALQLPDLVLAPIPLLKQHQNKSLSLSQEQIASLLANAFLCTFPYRNTTHAHSVAAKLPKINFASLYENTDESVYQKLQCICNYFRRVINKTPTGVVTFSRRSEYIFPNWARSDSPIESVPVYVNVNRKIEDANRLIQVDFANKFLGGGVLGNGLVQEEIRFLICPELMASMIFTESLEPNEALMIIGCERYNGYMGYGHSSFQWTGDYNDSTPVDSSGRRRCAVLAIDAEQYWNPNEQYQIHKIVRELNKAWVGFSFFKENYPSNLLVYPGVATGNWGCGAFNGDPQLKCLIQMMAAAVARRPLAYFTFGDEYFKKQVEAVYESCKGLNVTVGELFRCIIEYNYEKDLFSFLNDNVDEKLRQYRSGDKSYSTRPAHKKRCARENYSPIIDPNAGTSIKHHQGDQMRDNRNRSQTCHQDQMRGQSYPQEDQIRETHKGSQTNHQDQTRDNYNVYQTYHQNQMSDQLNRSHPKEDQIRDLHNGSQIHPQEDQMSNQLNISPNTYPHDPPQNLPSSSQNYKNDANYTSSNFQSSKNYGHHSEDGSERYGESGDQKASSDKYRGGPSHSQNKINTSSNFQTSKNYGRHSEDGSERYGGSGDQKASSDKYRGGPSHSQNQINTSSNFQTSKNYGHHSEDGSERYGGSGDQNVSSDKYHGGPSRSENKINTSSNFRTSNNYGHHSEDGSERYGGNGDQNASSDINHGGPSQSQNKINNTSSHFQSSKNYGHHSERYGASGDQKASSDIYHGGPSQSQNKNKSNAQASGGSQGYFTFFTRYFTAKRNPSVTCTDVLMRRGLDSTNIYMALNNLDALAISCPVDGSSGPDNASDETLLLD